MSPALLVVETADLEDAARSMGGGVAQPLEVGVGRAMGDAAGCLGMAGDDPAARDWAVAYERSARAAVRAARDVVSGCYRISSLFAITAQNYARAGAASDARAGGGDEAAGSLAVDPTVDPPVNFSVDFSGAGGGGSGAPFGWSYVQDAVGYAWPDGHQDRLHTAAAAWRRSAALLNVYADQALLPALAPLRDSLPEAEDMVDVCTALRHRLQGVSHAHAALARACEQFAEHLDLAHSGIEHELLSFAEWSAGIQLVGGVLSTVTLGGAEAPAQLEQAQRLALTIARVSAYLTRFVTTVRELTLALPGISELSAGISTAMNDILRIRIITADVTGVPGLRMLHVARDSKSLSAGAEASELAGTETRLIHAADESGALRRASAAPGSGQWANDGTLAKHFDEHAADFAAVSEDDYAGKAGAFFRRGLKQGLPTKIDEITGTIRIYDPATNTFGSFTVDGRARTLFKPSSATYWSRQKGVLQ